MAYLAEFGRTCGDCQKPASVELRNWQNQTMNWYCRPHGKTALKRLQDSEARESLERRQRNA